MDRNDTISLQYGKHDIFHLKAVITVLHFYVCSRHSSCPFWPTLYTRSLYLYNTFERGPYTLVHHLNTLE